MHRCIDEPETVIETIKGFDVNTLGLFGILPDLFEFVALSILLYISLKS
ncbi:MAG: hypothetical protein WBE22_08025 [Halobacteriota archaeon]